MHNYIFICNPPNKLEINLCTKKDKALETKLYFEKDI